MTAPTPPDPREQPLQYYGPPRPPTYTPGMPPISGAPVSPYGVICGHAARGDTKTGAAGGDGMAMAGLILGYIVVGPAIAFSIWMVLASGLGAVSN